MYCCSRALLLLSKPKELPLGEGVVNAAIVISHIVDAEVLSPSMVTALSAPMRAVSGLVARLNAAGGEHHAEQHKGDDDGV